MSRYCPKCGYGDSSRERRPNGFTTCNACAYSVLSQQWDKEQLEAEIRSGVSSRLRGNPLEIEARYFAMEKKIIDLEDHIDNMDWVIKDNTDTINEWRLHYGEEKHRSEQLELKILDLEKQIETYKAATQTSESNDSDAALDTKNNKAV